ncbi:MAG: glycosyltransferase family 39 protein [Pyrinomonadaceae bacterium]
MKTEAAHISEIDSPASETPSLSASWRWWLPIALLALTLALIFVDPFAGDWDALDYTVLAVQGHPSSMILGRSFFIFANHELWRIAHALFALPPEKAYLLFKYAVVLQSPLAVIAWWRLARDLTNSTPAATLAALLLTLSPFYIIYSGQAMTEIPSLLLLAIAVTIHLKGLRSRHATMVLAGAAVLGLGVNVREAALLFAPWLLVAPFACGWKLKRREIAVTALAYVVFLICAFGPFVFLLWSNVANFRWAWHGWIESSRLESVRHPVNIGNLLPLLHYFFIAAPLVFVAFPLAAFRAWKQRGLSPLLAFALIGVFANLSLIVHYSVGINWRYMLTGMPALTPLVADYFLHSQTAKLRSMQQAFVSVVLSTVIIAVIAGLITWPMGRGYLAERSLAKDYRSRLAIVPRDAVMISGTQTVAVTYWRGLGAGEWEVIGSGGAWPGPKLASVITTTLADGRRVFLDADPRWWSTDGWQQQEIVELVNIETHFRFRRISDTIYEIRPQYDETAFDQPHLSRLFPSNSSLIEESLGRAEASQRASQTGREP